MLFIPFQISLFLLIPPKLMYEPQSYELIIYKFCFEKNFWEGGQWELKKEKGI